MQRYGRRDFMKSVGLGLAFGAPAAVWASSEEGDSSPKMPAESFIVCLSSVNGTTVGVCLSLCITGTCVPRLRTGTLLPSETIMPFESAPVAL